MVFSQGFGWPDEVPGAMVFLASSYRIRVTDPRKNPLPNAKCRIADAPETVFICDEDGIAEIPIEDRSIASLTLEWESADAESGDPGDRFPWSNTFEVGIHSAEDEVCAKRLTHLGYLGSSLAEQVSAYQTYFGLEPTGEINDIRVALMEWHEGGTYPAHADDEGFDGSAAGADSGEPAGYSICLSDSHGNPIPNSKWSAEGADGVNLSGTADGEGWAEVSVPDSLEWIDLTWENPNGKDEPYRNKIHLRIGDGNAGVSAMLANLGYLGASREERLADFRNDFGYPSGTLDEMVLMDMAAWHDGGDMPPDERDVSNSAMA